MNLSENCYSPFVAIAMQNYDYFRNRLIVSMTFSAVLAIPATLGNGLIVSTVLKSKNLQTPSYPLITSLAFTEFLVGLVYQPFCALVFALYLYKDEKTLCSGRIFLDAGAKMSLYFGIVAFHMNSIISIDRYLALTLRHRYRIIITKKRVRNVILGCWLGTAVGLGTLTLTSYLIPVTSVNFILLAFTLPVLTTATIFYILSFKKLYQYTSHVNPQQSSCSLNVKFNVGKYRKTLITMVAVFVCFLVYSIFSVALYVSISLYGYTRLTLVVVLASTVAAALNSCINPVIFLTRFNDIRQECKKIFFHKICGQTEGS